MANKNLHKGLVIKLGERQVQFKAGSGALYWAQAWNAQLTRKFGAPMKFEEIVVGDKIEVLGQVTGDTHNPIPAEHIRNLSLYPRSVKLTGKIESFDFNNSAFKILSKQRGLQTVYTDKFTVLKKNNLDARPQDFTPGLSVSIKGTWERPDTLITAKEVISTQRLIKIYITGRLAMRSPTTITVIGKNNAIYGVDITASGIQSKGGRALHIGELHSDDLMRVWGKHMSGSVEIVAEKVKDVSIK